MGSRRATPVTLPHDVTERLSEWRGLKAGDHVRIDGDRDGRYVLRYVDVLITGIEIAWLWGGRKGHAIMRPIGGDRIVPEPGHYKASREAGSEDQLVLQQHDIRGRREALKLSRKQLAELSDTSQAAIASLEAGREPRDRDARTRIMAALSNGDAPTPSELEALGLDLEDEDEEDEL